MTRTLKNLTLAAVAIAAFASPALAQSTPDGAPSVQLKAAGYDLSSPQGVAALTRKARTAAALVCQVGGDRDLGRVMTANRCFNLAVADANRQIEALRLVRMARRADQQVAAVDVTKLPDGK